jgi:D-glycero-D-manno-heptose 1,7-bisphosphate phosphatase
MPRPAVFFDRDNTLIRNDGYLGDPAGVILFPDAADAIAAAQRFGFAIVTISNQSGVARGMFDEDAVKAVNMRMDELLQQQNPAAIIDRHEYCPFHPQAVVEKYRRESDLRKPKPGMILRAAAEMDLDLAKSWLIGDAPRDIEAGHAAGCRTILIQSTAIAKSPAAREKSVIQPDFSVNSLDGAIKILRTNEPC